MSIQPIRLFGDPVLVTPAAQVVDFDKELRTLVADLTDTMLEAPGVGLAAPQIGVGLRVFVWDVDEALGHLINPTLDLSDELQDGEEGLPQTARKPPPLRPQRRAHCQAVAEQLRLLAQPRARQRATGRAPLLAVTATAHARGINGSHAALADPYSMERVCASQVSIAVAVRPFGGGARWAQANTS